MDTMKQKKKKEIKDAEGFIEIPFGAFDSETMGWTYTIPEGFTAKIENGKIIVEKKEGEDERIRKHLITHFQKKTRGEWNGMPVKNILAWLEKQKDAETEIENAYKNADKIQYKKGFEDGVASVKPAEWSENDRDKIAEYLHGRGGGMLWSKATEITEDILGMIHPQPHWKPSEEQINALAKAIITLGEQGDNKTVMYLNEIRTELKKL